MAEPEERSLDDFFAKRDKKKKKEKGGGGGAGRSPAGSRPPEGPILPGKQSSKVARKEKSVKNDNPDTQQEKEDDEWKEFEQKEVDYSGLRIQSLQISNEKEEDENEKREQEGGDWEETGSGSTEKSSGPWNKAAPAPAPAAVVIDTPEPVQPSGVYRPPGARVSTTRKPPGPPEIYSDTQFPSLQSTAKHIESRKDKEMEKTFEVVRHKNRGRDEASKNQSLQLQLDNQYAVLGEQ
ncbi:protein CDV3 homolog [Microcaecilia unicolor]|uniref:Protein CDV3 homolog n=1 Tax=Microcaecilia unicolor TaxID=1415580 RepID=A0A6P7Y4J6_9AMPH|nr:protein CDV3 homolog [Microcaecilia unicolor]